MKSFEHGLPITFCRDLVHTESEYYLVLLLSTVLINVWAMSLLTSEKNNPFLEGLNDWTVPSALNTRNPSLRVLSYVTLCFFCTLLKDKMFMMPSGWNHTIPYPIRSPFLVIIALPTLQYRVRFLLAS